MHHQLHNFLAHLLVNAQLLQPQRAEEYLLDRVVLYLYSALSDQPQQITVAQIQIDIFGDAGIQKVNAGLFSVGQ